MTLRSAKITPKNTGKSNFFAMKKKVLDRREIKVLCLYQSLAIGIGATSSTGRAVSAVN